MNKDYSTMTAAEVLKSLNSTMELLQKLPHGLPKELKVWCNDLLPPGTMMVSPDLFQQFKQIPKKDADNGKASR